MPGYSGTNLANTVYQNRQVLFWNAELPPVGSASVAYELAWSRGTSRPGQSSITIMLSAAPGAYEIDVQAADIDQAGAYVTFAQFSPGNATLNASFSSRLDLAVVNAKYIRLLLVANPNAVTITALLNRS